MEMPILTQDKPVAVEVQDLLAQVQHLWWDCPTSLPAFQHTYESRQQAHNEKQLSRLTDGLIYELKHMPASGADLQEFQQRMRGQAVEFFAHTLELSPQDVSFLESSGMLEAMEEFTRQARAFDPHISGEDIYQAGRNVVTMTFIQRLMGLPVEVTPAVFAYSMLYPYTDNYLDDPRVSREQKRAFNRRFKERLEGGTIVPANQHEEQINRLVSRIEDQYPRVRFPRVWDSLLAIFLAQAHSLKLVLPGASPYEADVLGISLEKGGTSVLADGYLVAGWLSPQEAQFMFDFGAFTQLMDDLEDIEADLREGQMSIFSQTAPHWKLDAVTNRLFHFGRKVIEDNGVFAADSTQPLFHLIQSCLNPMLIDIVGRAGRFCSRGYLKELESHLPFRFAALNQQRSKLERNKMTLGRIVNSWF